MLAWKNLLRECSNKESIAQEGCWNYNQSRSLYQGPAVVVNPQGTCAKGQMQVAVVFTAVHTLSCHKHQGRCLLMWWAELYRGKVEMIQSFVSSFNKHVLSTSCNAKHYGRHFLICSFKGRQTDKQLQHFVKTEILEEVLSWMHREK